MRFRSVLLVLMSTTFLVQADELKKSVLASQILTTNAMTDPVQPGAMHGVYGTGMFYARPTRGRANSGYFIKTDELHLIVGNFQDDTKYSGNTIDVSTKSHAVFEQIEALDQSKHYIFNYWHSYPFRLDNLEDTDTKIISVEDSKDAGDFLSSGLPTGFNVQNGRVGRKVSRAEANGRMVDVFRWNTYFLGRPICTFWLDSGGSRRTDEGPVANETAYNVYSEQGCRYLESILPYGLELKVTFTQNFFTMDRYHHTAEQVVVDSIPGMYGHPQVPVQGVGPVTEQFLDDPIFQERINKMIDERWKKLHPETPSP